MRVAIVITTGDFGSLSARLAGSSLGGKVFLTNSGAEAVEAALKLVRRARTGGKVIVIQDAFHGRTYGALSATPQEAKLSELLHFGSWIGGDRDGNPNVTADSLRLALAQASRAALDNYLDQLHALGAELSISTELASTTPEVEKLAESSGDDPRYATACWCRHQRSYFLGTLLAQHRVP